MLCGRLNEKNPDAWVITVDILLTTLTFKRNGVNAKFPISRVLADRYQLPIVGHKQQDSTWIYR